MPLSMIIVVTFEDFSLDKYQDSRSLHVCYYLATVLWTTDMELSTQKLAVFM